MMKKPMRKMRGGMGAKKQMRGGGANMKPVMAKKGKAMRAKKKKK